MSRTLLTFLPYHQDDIIITHLSYYRKPSHLTMWPWTSRGRSGSSWPLFRRPCTGMWCWRTIATWCLWVRTAPLGHWPGPQSVAFPFSASESSGASVMLSGLAYLSFWKLWSGLWCSVSSLAQEKWVYSLFCKKSLDSVGCEIVLASHVAFCRVHRPQGKLTGPK